MTTGYIDLALFMVLLTVLALLVGKYMVHVVDTSDNGGFTFLGALENYVYQFIGLKADKNNNQMNWLQYSMGLIWFNLIGIAFLFILQLIQGILPLNPQHFAAPSWDSALNTAISFVSNTDWQSYTPETTMSYLTQMLGLATQNFLSAASGIAVLFAFIRGFTNVENSNLGNVWHDLVRITLYILLPLSLVLAVTLGALGVPQNFHDYQVAHVINPQVVSKTVANKTVKQTINTQIIPQGPIASQEAIKMLGTNGGGFFNANSAHPYENPNAISNLLEMLAMLLIPAASCFTLGALVKDKRQGYTLYIAMAIVFIVMVIGLIGAEIHGNPLFKHLAIDQQMSQLQSGGNMEGKETRFGIFASSIFTTATTAASCGAVNTMHDSLTPLGGMVPLFLMQLSEVIFGGVGSGLYTMLIFAILSVFIAGLMIGRTPEYLGKKIDSFDMKMVAIVILVVPLVILVGTAVSVVINQGLAGMSNIGAHGFSEVLYAFTSAGNNNGSAFAGINANTPYYNLMLGAVMLVGRYGVIIPVLALAGNLASKKHIPVSNGTMPTHGVLFICILIGIVFIVGALTYVPALALGPVVEHLMLIA